MLFKLKHIMLMALVTVATVGGAAGVAHAQSFRSGDTATVAAGETVSGSLFTSAKTIDIAGTVEGDVFCAGQTVTISGVVDGDVICAGQTVRITGTVMGDVRVAGQSVTIDATVAGSASVLGQMITIDSGADIARDLSTAGQTVGVRGMVARDVIIGSSSATVDTMVGRNIVAAGEKLTLGSSANVTGNVEFTSNNQVSQTSGAVVTGSVVRHTPERKETNEGGKNWRFTFFALIAMLLFIAVLVMIAPRFFESTAEIALKKIGAVFLTGFATSLFMPIALILLCVTMVGIPLAVLGLAVWFTITVVALPVAAYILGKLVVRRWTNEVRWYALAGMSLFMIIWQFPIIGAMVCIFLYWLGLGATVWKIKQMLANQRTKPVPVAASVKKRSHK